METKFIIIQLDGVNGAHGQHARPHVAQRLAQNHGLVAAMAQRSTRTIAHVTERSRLIPVPGVATLAPITTKVVHSLPSK